MLCYTRYYSLYAFVLLWIFRGMDDTAVGLYIISIPLVYCSCFHLPSSTAVIASDVPLNEGYTNILHEFI